MISHHFEERMLDWGLILFYLLMFICVVYLAILFFKEQNVLNAIKLGFLVTWLTPSRSSK